MSTPLLSEFVTCPAVFAIRDYYRIMVPSKSPILFWVEVNGKKYYDHSNGIIRSAHPIHGVSVPMKELDAAGEYTVAYRKIPERKPYFNEPSEPEYATYKFRPVPTEGKINIYHLADTHGDFEKSSVAGSYFGEDIDLLILNGDTANSSGSTDYFMIIYQLCEALTHGERTCLFSRGNHDMRGICAELVEQWLPCDRGISYFPFRVGSLWGLVLDCAEDKRDEGVEYGWVNCCHEFRLDETEFIRDLTEKADTEWGADGVKYRLVIAHQPFTHKQQPPFDIEQDIYAEWVKLLDASVKPQAMIAGHMHETRVSFSGDDYDNGVGQICPLIVGACPGKNRYTGCAITLDGDKLSYVFNASDGEILGKGEFAI